MEKRGFGIILKRKKFLIEKIARLETLFINNLTQDTLNELNFARKELDEVLKNKEILWACKATTNWMINKE